MAKTKRSQFTDPAVQAVQERRRSNAPGSHAQGTRRQRSRAAGRQAAIRRATEHGWVAIDFRSATHGS